MNQTSEKSKKAVKKKAQKSAVKGGKLAARAKRLGQATPGEKRKSSASAKRKSAASVGRSSDVKVKQKSAASTKVKVAGKRAAAPKTERQWAKLAERRLEAILDLAHVHAGLRKLGSFGRASKWSAAVQLVGAPAMVRLNGQYRGKTYATDVLSFPTPVVFQDAGQLGEIVICLPTLKRQARERKHSEQEELEILLVHGVLHLLGLDHELGTSDAREMSRWESRLLGGDGLIEKVGR